MDISWLRCCPRLYTVTLRILFGQPMRSLLCHCDLFFGQDLENVALLKPLILNQSARVSFPVTTFRAYRTDARRLRQHGTNCPSIRCYLWICEFSATPGRKWSYGTSGANDKDKVSRYVLFVTSPPSCVGCVFVRKCGVWQGRAIEIWIKRMFVSLCSVQASRMLCLSYWLFPGSGVAWLLTPRARNHNNRV